MDDNSNYFLNNDENDNEYDYDDNNIGYEEYTQFDTATIMTGKEDNKSISKSQDDNNNNDPISWGLLRRRRGILLLQLLLLLFFIHDIIY